MSRWAVFTATGSARQTATLSRSCATLSDMRPERRDFMKCGALSVLGLAGERALEAVPFAPHIAMPSHLSDPSPDKDLSVIGSYGSWAASLNGGRLPSFSFRNKRFGDVAAWRESARKCLMERMAIPAIGSTPKVTIKREYVHDRVRIEELSWQLPYGRPTEALVIRPLTTGVGFPVFLRFTIMAAISILAKPRSPKLPSNNTR
jgi:hypothetical protein